jgi:ATP-dependent DNA helicase DinG
MSSSPVDRSAALELVKTAQKNLAAKRGLSPRASQNMMITTVAKTLLDTFENPGVAGTNLAVIEAPTGTGKSFGYLLPAIPIAVMGRKKIVVSTAVVSLQEQLFKQDLPALSAALPMAFTYAIAKGRSRFVCPSRLKEHVDTLKEEGAIDLNMPLSTDTFSVGSPKDDIAKVVFKAWSDWQKKSWDGEQESLTWSDDEKKIWWGKLTTDSHGCSNKSCSMYKECPYFAARQKWKDADVVIANHDLVMSDLALGGGMILSDPEDTIYIFDEAHHIPGKARDAWATSFKTETFSKMVREIGSVVIGIGKAWSEQSEDSAKKIGDMIIHQKDNWESAVKNFKREQERFEKSITAFIRDAKPKEPVVLSYNAPPEIIIEAGRPWSTESANLLELVTTLKDKIVSSRDALLKGGYSRNGPLTEEGEMNRILGALGVYMNRLKNLDDTLKQWVRNQPAAAKPPIAKWIVPGDNRKDFSIHATPTMATDILPGRLYDKAFAVIYASATLSSVNGFSLFRQKTGLCYYVNAKSLKLESPFNFKDNAVLVCGDLGVNPTDNAAHSQRLIDTLPVVIEDNQEMGTLVLFTSKSQMETVVSSLPLHILKQCKIQYTASNNALIERHKADIDEGRASILIGTQSFSEGLDLPGAWCSHVIITKIPFSVPDNPIDKTLTAWLESQGRRVFSEIAIPEAAERLIQQAGRLIRREDDHGRITILDNRLVTKWKAYGESLVKALPPFSRKKLDLTKTYYKKGTSAPAKQAVYVARSIPGRPIGLPEMADREAGTWEVEEALL